MAIKNREDLKAYFTNQTIPSENQFRDLIDSLLNKRDDQFYGKWKPGISYNKGDVVIHDKMLWILTLNDDPNAVDHCSAKGPVVEEGGPWEQLILMVDDADWQVVEPTEGSQEPSIMYAKVYGKVGIGTDDPIAKLDITDGVKGQFLFNPDSHEDPSFSIINLDPECKTNYLISSVGADHAAWISDAPLGFAFKKGGSNMTEGNTTDPGQGEILMVIRENEQGKVAVGIGTDQPNAMLDITDGEKGRFQFSPEATIVPKEESQFFSHTEGGAAPMMGLFNLDGESDLNYLITQIGADNVMWISDAPNGFMLRKGSEYDPDGVDKHVDPGQLILLVRLDENGHPQLGLGVEDPHALLTVSDGHHATLELGPENAEGTATPGIRILSMPGGEAETFLNTEVGQTFASWITDADRGFEWRIAPGEGETENTLIMVAQQSHAHKPRVGIGTAFPAAMLDIRDIGTGRFVFAPENFNDPAFVIFDKDSEGKSNYLINSLGKEEALWGTDAPNGFMFLKNKEYTPMSGKDINRDEFLMIIRQHSHEGTEAKHAQVGIGEKDPHALLEITNGTTTRIELGEEGVNGVAQPIINLVNIEEGEDNGFLQTQISPQVAKWLTDARNGFEWQVLPAPEGEAATFLMVVKQTHHHKPRVGIGTDRPAAMLDIRDKDFGRFVFAPETFNDPAFVMFDKDSDGKTNYLINSLGKEEAIWGTDAPNGFMFLKNREYSPMKGKEVNKDGFLMIIRQHSHEGDKTHHAQAGIGEKDPHALLELTDAATTRIELGEEGPDGTPQPIINLVNLKKGKDDGFVQTQISNKLTSWLTDAKEGFEWRMLPAPEGKDSTFVMIAKQDRNHKPRVGIGTDHPGAMLDIRDKDFGRFVFAPETFNDPAFVIFDKDSDGNSNYLISSLGKNEAVWGTDAPNGFMFLKNREFTPMKGKKVNKEEFLMIIRQHHHEGSTSQHAQAGIGEKDPHALLEITDATTTRIELGEEGTDGKPQPVFNLVNLKDGKDKSFLQTQVSDELTSWLTDTQNGFEWRMRPAAQGEESTFLMIAKQNAKHKPRVGIGTENPAAMLDIRDDDFGRFVFAPETFNDPAFVIFDKDSDGKSNYLINSLGKNEAIWGTDAPNGFMFLKNREFSPMSGKEVNKDEFLMIVRQNASDKEPQVGIGSKDPRAMLDVSDGNKGQLLFSPHEKADPALTIINLDTPNDPNYLTSGVGAREATFITDAHRGFNFRTGEEFGKNESEINLNQGKSMMVIVPDNGKGDGHPKVGIGTENPLAKLDITNGISGQFLFNLDRKVNPAMSIINLRPGSKRNYLATGVGNKHAIMVTDAPFGFMFKRGDDSEKSPGVDTEVDINQGEILMSMLPDAKVGIGRIPSNYEMDVHGQARSFNMYLNTDEARTNELGVMDSVLDNVKKLRPVRFVWQRETGLQDEGEQFGLISHEVDDVFPQVVKTDSSDATSAVSYQNLVPVLVKAVQEQQEMIETQAAQIEEMREMLQKLMKK